MIFFHLDTATARIFAQHKQEELFAGAIFLADSAVKNRDENFPVLGSAYYNSETKRVEQNVIDLELLKKIDQNSGIGGLSLKSVFVEFLGGKKEIVFEKKTGKNCIGIERFVFAKNHFKERKAKIFFVVCHEN
ncbi:MAG: hypothetical protein HYW50_04610 [Candidatus Diapherotrites archaeon]|nr:hypothetical protein [Candidatus Diapherotrites archaeon]